MSSLVGFQAFICDSEGLISERLGAESDAIDVPSAGAFLHEMILASERPKLVNFLGELASQGRALHWEFTCAGGTGKVPVLLTGFAHQGILLVIASSPQEDITPHLEMLARINNEQANRLRDAARQLRELNRRNDASDSSVYDELMRVNNELASSQRELARRNAELARLNELKNRLLGTAAHDLRNPLSVVTSYARAMLRGRGGDVSERQQFILESIQKSTSYMLGLVEDLLDYSAIESGQMNLDMEEVDLNELVTRVVIMNRVLSEQKSIQIDFDRTSGSLRRSADARKLEQVLQNLVSNAVKFSPPDTRIEVTLEGDEGSEVLLAVQDEGPGIPLAEQSKIFQPFQRTSVKASAGEQSTGLGLSIVRQIVEAHGGSIQVDSEPGRGSRFWFRLPPVTQREDDQDSEGPPPPSPFS